MGLDLTKGSALVFAVAAAGFLGCGGSGESVDAGASTGHSGGEMGHSGGTTGAAGGSTGGSTGGAAGAPSDGAAGAPSSGGHGSGGVLGSGGTGGSPATGGTGGGAGTRGKGGAGGSTTGASGGSGPGGVRGGGGAPSQSAVTWSPNVRLNDDTGQGNQSEVTMAAGPNGLVLAGWMDSRATRVCAFSFSTDGGATWSKNVSIPNSTGSFVGDPAVAIDSGGTMYAVCQQYIDVNAGTGNVRMMTSSDRGATWSAIRSVQSAPDKPWAAGGTEDGVVFVSWLGSSAGIKRSLDHGQTWGAIQPLGNIIHGTGITTSTTGLLHVPYNLDSSRNQLRYLRSKDNGGTYDAPRDLVADMGTFCFSCSPRQHPIVGSAADPTGRFVAITWSSQMPGGQSDDDVWLLYSSDGGDTWSKPIRVNDNTTASRQFQSWVAVDTYGRVHVAWTDLRDGGQNETWYARSADPTKGFEKNLQITDGHGSANTDFLGDYKGIVVQDSNVLVVWNDTRRDSGDIYFSRAVGAAGP